MVFLHHQIPLKIAVAPHFKTRLNIIRRRDGFIAHRQFGVDGGEHGGVLELMRLCDYCGLNVFENDFGGVEFLGKIHKAFSFSKIEGICLDS